MAASTQLKRLMESEGRTQAWLARRLGVKRQQVGLWVNGIHIPAEPTRDEIARVLGRKVDDLWPAEPVEELKAA